MSGNKARLFDAISGGGIVKVCEKCSLEEDMPVIKRPTTFQLKESEAKKTIYERLSYAAGIKKENKPDSELLKKQETISLLRMRQLRVNWLPDSIFPEIEGPKPKLT